MDGMVSQNVCSLVGGISNLLSAQPQMGDVAPPQCLVPSQVPSSSQCGRVEQIVSRTAGAASSNNLIYLVTGIPAASSSVTIQTTNAVSADNGATVTSSTEPVGFKTPRRQQRKRRASSLSTNGAESPATTPSPIDVEGGPSPGPLSASRHDNSLSILTTRFMKFLNDAPETGVNLNEIAGLLRVQKRRLYDITNVLEGINLIEKVGKNSIRWKSAEEVPSEASQVECAALQQEISDLESREAELDRLISDMQNSLNVDAQDEQNRRYAYVTYQDIRSVPQFKEQTVIAVKAPTDSRLEVPDPAESGKMQVYLKSSAGGHIEAFICPDLHQSAFGPENTLPGDSREAQPSDFTLWSSQFQQPQSSDLLKSGMQNNMISHEPEAIGTDGINSVADMSGFLSLNPPLESESVLGSDFRFTLEPQEGLTELFDTFGPGLP